MAKYLIGIDPDIEASGYGIYNQETGTIEDYGAKDFWSLVELLHTYKHNSIVIIEGGWLIRKKNWRHIGNTNVGERIAYNVGQNHCVGQLLQAYCEKNGIQHSVCMPRGKIDRKSFQMITGITKRVSQDVIDAIMLVYKLHR